MNQKYKRTSVFAIVCLTMIFFVGMWTVDLGASMQNIECSTGLQPLAEGLMQRDVRPATVYHMGLVEMTAAWITLAWIGIVEVMG